MSNQKPQFDKNDRDAIESFRLALADSVFLAVVPIEALRLTDPILADLVVLTRKAYAGVWDRLVVLDIAAHRAEAGL